MAGDSAHQRKQQSKIPPEARRLIDFLNTRRRGEKPDGLRDTDAAAAVIDAVIGSLVADLQALVQKVNSTASGCARMSRAATRLRRDAQPDAALALLRRLRQPLERGGPSTTRRQVVIRRSIVSDVHI